MQKATFGAGCFWGVEAAFSAVPGVVSTLVGYTGGTFPNPIYQDVCRGNTGHAEAVQIEYDPAVVSYQALLDVFWSSHNPAGRQGEGGGSQYRSAIFFHDREQEEVARMAKESLQNSGQYQTPVATEIVPAVTFYRAEEHHQQYLKKRGRAASHG
jgi:peptide-methionine (S)-S-oxide reductase